MLEDSEDTNICITSQYVILKYKNNILTYWRCFQNLIYLVLLGFRVNKLSLDSANIFDEHLLFFFFTSHLSVSQQINNFRLLFDNYKGRDYSTLRSTILLPRLGYKCMLSLELQEMSIINQFTSIVLLPRYCCCLGRCSRCEEINDCQQFENYGDKPIGLFWHNIKMAKEARWE